jgi:phosphoribosyl-dephospho-CoA transferase
MLATASHMLELREKRQRRQRKILEEHAPHRAVDASAIGVPTSAAIVCIPGSRLNKI